MNDDVRTTIYRTLTLFIIGVVVWISFIFLNACGFSLACKKAAPLVDRTPVPTLIPATMPAMEQNSKPAAASDKCRVAAADLIGAWVSANSPETDAFQFTNTDGRACETTYAEVAPLFIEPNFWYNGSRSCVYCHSADMTTSSAQLDLSSYAGIKSGSRRADAESKGTNILGAGKWESSLLYQFLSKAKADVPGHTVAMSTGYFVYAGKLLPTP
jgi:hypothetical protein